MYGFVDDESRLAIVGDVGRRAVRLGLTDGEGRLRRDTICSYGPGEQSTIAGALAAFGQAHRLPRLPRRCAPSRYRAPRWARRSRSPTADGSSPAPGCAPCSRPSR